MFKLGVISDEISQDFERVVKLATEFKLDSIEIRSVWDKPPQELTDRDVDEMKRIMDGTGLQVVSIAAPFYKCDFEDMEERRQHIEILKRCIKLAKSFGANIVRGFAFWNTGRTEEIWDGILEAFEEPVKIIQDEGVFLGIENEASTSLSTAKLTRKFIEDLNCPNVRAIWDPANEVFAEGGEKPFPDAYNRLKPYMIHGHIKDAKHDPQSGEIVSVPVGEGVVGWREQFQAFIDDGYEGHLSLETHWRPTKTLSEDLLNRPGGSAFSEAGEEATRVCLEKIFEIIESLRR
jgi:sugar phosphate isomerase/epimerase